MMSIGVAIAVIAVVAVVFGVIGFFAGSEKKSVLPQAKQQKL